MILSTKIKITGTYKGNSKFPFWNKLEVGDIVEISTPIKTIYRAGTGLYATGINFKNLTKNTKFNSTMNMAVKYLNQLKYEENV